MKFITILTILLTIFTFSCDEDDEVIAVPDGDTGGDDDGYYFDDNEINYEVCTNCIWLQNDCIGNWILGYNIDNAISGFQFNINGANIISVSGGDAENANFSVSAGSQTVLGFSFSGDSIDAGSGTLCVIDLNGTPESISNITFSDTNAEELNIFSQGIINCYSSSLNNTGVSQLTIFNNTITNLEIGDEIGIFDLNGIINYNDCSNQRGELLVGAGVWDGEQLEVVSIGAVDLCNINGIQLSGYVNNNPLLIRVYRHQTGQEYVADISWDIGAGAFGEIIQSINNLTLSPINL